MQSKEKLKLSFSCSTEQKVQSYTRKAKNYIFSPRWRFIPGFNQTRKNQTVYPTREQFHSTIIKCNQFTPSQPSGISFLFHHFQLREQNVLIYSVDRAVMQFSPCAKNHNLLRLREVTGRRPNEISISAQRQMGISPARRTESVKIEKSSVRLFI